MFGKQAKTNPTPLVELEEETSSSSSLSDYGEDIWPSLLDPRVLLASNWLGNQAGCTLCYCIFAVVKTT